ncbi:MAG TPA: bifunctional glutamate N-acetyltransferase/amino-acid acetyltransferase ArgJ [Nitrospiraceae bacterium]|nr:bifunctional glutamate N-acetyltransferase/amino-acid acetyltransferase ArgJ [Nitrospiraceae bacterium]
MNTVPGGITAPRGFRAGGIHCGIKKNKQLDLALVVSEREGPVAALFTTNQVAAAPVLLDRIYLRRGLGRAIIINSGNANACTGPEGFLAAETMATTVARHLDTMPHKVFVGSTGVIGQRLPIERIKAAVPLLLKRVRRNGGLEAARAIMTTDLHPKQAAIRSRIGNRMVTIGGMVKGSGMIHPSMATMLAYFSTDAVITRQALQQSLEAATARSFNAITVDGDTSTNDTVLCLANGMADNELIEAESRAQRQFEAMLTAICRTLALKICRDGEGVTKVVKISVTGAPSPQAARRVADTIATSSLVKTALFGEDANWGRIMAAIGRSGVRIDPSRISLRFDEVTMVKNGQGLGVQAERLLSRVFRRKEFTIRVDLRLGHGTSEVWTTDLSLDYVKINASYRS